MGCNTKGYPGNFWSSVVFFFLNWVASVWVFVLFVFLIHAYTLHICFLYAGNIMNRKQSSVTIISFTATAVLLVTITQELPWAQIWSLISHSTKRNQDSLDGRLFHILGQENNQECSGIFYHCQKARILLSLSE